MTISFKCSSCGKAYEVGNELAGKKGKCACGAVFLVPAANAGAPPPQTHAQRPAPQPPQPQVPLPAPAPQPAPQAPAGGSPHQPLTPMGGAPPQQSGMPQQPGMPGQPGQMPMGGMPQQPGQLPMGGMPQQPGQMQMGGMPQQPGQMPMGGMPQQPGQMPMGGMPGQLPMGGMPGQMPAGGNPYAGPAAMGQPHRQASGNGNPGIARGGLFTAVISAATLGGVLTITSFLSLIGLLMLDTSAGPRIATSGSVGFLGKMAQVFTVVAGIIMFLAPLGSITGQWMFMAIPKRAGKGLAMAAAITSSAGYLMFVLAIFLSTDFGAMSSLGATTAVRALGLWFFLLLLTFMGWWVVHHISLYKCCSAYGSPDGARTSIVSCIVGPASFIILVVLIVLVAPTDVRSASSAGSVKARMIITNLAGIACLVATTLLYCKALSGAKSVVR